MAVGAPPADEDDREGQFDEIAAVVHRRCALTKVHRGTPGRDDARVDGRGMVACTATATPRTTSRAGTEGRTGAGSAPQITHADR